MENEISYPILSIWFSTENVLLKFFFENPVEIPSKKEHLKKSVWILFRNKVYTKLSHSSTRAEVLHDRRQISPLEVLAKMKNEFVMKFLVFSV